MKTREILAPYPLHDKNLYAFLNNIPLDILGLMKVFYEAQTSVTNTDKNIPSTVLKGNYFTIQPYSPLAIFSNEIKTNSIQFLGIYTREPEELVKYPSSSTYNLYYDISQRQSLPE